MMNRKMFSMLLALMLLGAAFLTGCGSSGGGTADPDASAQGDTQSVQTNEDSANDATDTRIAERDNNEPEDNSVQEAGDTEQPEETDAQRREELSVQATEGEPATAEPAAGTPEDHPAEIQTLAETPAPTEEPDAEPVKEPAPAASATTLVVRFGDDGDPFTLYMEDNVTANDIVRCVGTAAWRLPIYHYDDYDGWESMQYYDIPSRYEITPGTQSITSAKAGEVYYSEPNRIVLFYHDATISGDYTLVGTFDATEEFVQAVEENPVLEGWNTKIVNISID